MKPIYLASAYHELTKGDGIMRVEAGNVVVANDDGTPAAAYPPEAFAEAFSDFDVASLPRSKDGQSVDTDEPAKEDA